MVDRALAAGILGFSFGVACWSLLSLPWPAAAFAALLGLALIALWSLRRASVLLFAGILLLSLALGAGRVALAPTGPPDAFAARIGTAVELEGSIVTDPDIREATQRITVEVEADEERTRVLVVAQLYPELSYGEKVRVAGKLAAPQPFDTDGGRVFRYDRFLAKDGIFLIINFAEVEALEEPRGLTRTRGMLFAAKRWFVEGLERSLVEPYASLAAGLITGGKQGLGPELLDAFVIAGLIHIVVLSGYNVMIVAEAVLRSLAFLPKRAASAAAAVTIGLFVFAAGAGAASVRAGLMAGVALFARASGRTYIALRALVFAGFLMLLFNPFLLAFDPGFQLSFVATVGLILGAPLVERWFSFVRNRPLRELAAATTAAQIAVLPLLLYQTGNLSFMAFPANLLVLPAVPLAMLLSFIAAIMGLLLPPLAPVFGAPALLFLGYIVAVAELSASLPFAQVIVPQFPFVLVVLAYAALSYAVLRRSK